MEKHPRIAVPWLREDCAQDVAEYCLLTALIVLIGFAIFWHFSGGLQGLWTTGNAALASGNQAVSAPAAGGVSGN